MKQSWTLSELKEQWSLTPVELELTAGRTGVNQLGFAVLLKFFQLEGKFPENFRDIPKQVLNYLARFLKLKGSSLSSYNFKGRSSKRHRTEIRAFAGFRPSNPKPSKFPIDGKLISYMNRLVALTPNPRNFRSLEKK